MEAHEQQRPEDRLSVPEGGGALATETASEAARLVALAARRSLGWPGAEEAAARAEALRAETARLAEEIAAAYERAREALDAARIAVEPSAERNERLGDALALAAELPLQAAAAAAEIAVLAADGARHADDEIQPDCVAAALLAAAAAEAAAHLVTINLAITPGDEWEQEASAHVDTAHGAVRRTREAARENR